MTHVAKIQVAKHLVCLKLLLNCVNLAGVDESLCHWSLKISGRNVIAGHCWFWLFTLAEVQHHPQCGVTTHCCPQSVQRPGVYPSKVLMSCYLPRALILVHPAYLLASLPGSFSTFEGSFGNRSFNTPSSKREVLVCGLVLRSNRPTLGEILHLLAC